MGQVPPYLDISPDRALTDLDPPVATTDFARIAEACARGRADLAARGAGETGSKTLRRFSTWRSPAT